MRFVVLIASAVILLGIAVWPATGPGGASAGGDAQPSGGGFDKLIGTSTGHFHTSFPDYIQVYDGVSTATVEWEEHPELLGEGCHCRAFLPTGGIDWIFQYVTESCSDTDSGHVEAGQGLPDPKQHMLVLWEDPNDPKQYLYSGNGVMEGNASIGCDGGFTIEIPDFLDIGEPDRINTTTPSPFAAGQPAAAQTGGAQPAGAPARSCDSEFRVARDAGRIKDSCYSGDSYNPYDYTTYTWDFRLPPEPIVFIHGIMGSQIKCGNDELWPHIPPLPKLLEMALAEDGVSPAPGACAGASVGDLLATAGGTPVYQATIDFLDGLAPDIEYFNWDWRKSPQQSLALLDSRIAKLRSTHENSKVVIMAHSYGGLLARLYVDNPGRAANVARVLTVGTPAWGSPGALFPLYAGVKVPGWEPMDLVLDNEDLKELSRNLTGTYMLYPSASYGDWLTVAPGTAPFNQQAALLAYVSQIGGNAILLGQALASHANTLDHHYIAGPSGPKFEVVVGTGLATITAVQIQGSSRVRVRYGSGDGTVPATSAARGVVGPANSNRDHTHYACGVDHVALPGDQQITDAVRDYLLFGDDIKPMRGICQVSGDEWVPYRLSALPADTSAVGPAGSGAMTLEAAVLQGVVDYLDLPDQPIAVTNGEFPPVALPPAKLLQVSPISDEGTGPATVYGPLDGEITISKGPNGRTVLVDGQPAPIHGDVNCDKAVTVMDALLLVLHAGGTSALQPAGCAAIGSGTEPFGDIDCDTAVTALDALADLQMVAGVSLTLLDGCR